MNIECVWCGAALWQGDRGYCSDTCRDTHNTDRRDRKAKRRHGRPAQHQQTRLDPAAA